ncbi:MAG: N-acetylglucosamine-6-phosphate deacetylase [Pyrinomonadaceae bacterium]
MTTADDSLLLSDARLILPGRVIEPASVLIEKDRILRISSEHESSGAGSVRDLRGLTLFPGFIDAHIHGAVGIDTMEASEHDLASVSEFLSTQGVTGWLPTLVPAPAEHYARAIDAIGKQMRSQRRLLERPSGARVLGVHYEGPFVNASQCGALRSEHFKTFSGPSDIDSLPSPEVPNVVCMMTLAPEIEGGVDLVRELDRRGWIVAIGHTRAGIAVLDLAHEAGARHMTHFMNAMPSLHHREPGPVGWALSRSDVRCDIVADGIHLAPFVLGLLLSIKGADRLSLISDAIAAAGKGDGEYKIWGETITVKDGRTSNSRGSIAGSVITMLDAVKMMLSLGASEVDVARMAATSPARLLRIDNACGSIEVGKRADLVALDDEGNVRLTLIGGSVAFQK